MTVLRLVGDYNDPWLDCEECDSHFQIVWNRNPLYLHVEYCPFCGDSVEEIVDELDE